MKFGRNSLVALVLQILVIQFSCAIGENGFRERIQALPEAPLGGFVVQVFAMESGQERAFIEHLRECALPVWNDLRAAGVVSAVDLFELSEMETTLPVSPPWRYLVVAEIEADASAADFSDTINPDGSDAPARSVVREERTVCTPNSCFGRPEPTYPDAPEGIDYLIEFIAVENTSASLAKYQGLMSSYIGPANGLLVDRGLLHCFVALETNGNEIREHEVVPWNQLHISDHWEEGGDIDWEAVYEDLLREEFSRELDDVWSELPPIRDISTEYRARLVPDLCVR
jgi:hypothetical protein